MNLHSECTAKVMGLFPIGRFLLCDSIGGQILNMFNMESQPILHNCQSTL